MNESGVCTCPCDPPCESGECIDGKCVCGEGMMLTDGYKCEPIPTPEPVCNCPPPRSWISRCTASVWT